MPRCRCRSPGPANACQTPASLLYWRAGGPFYLLLKSRLTELWHAQVPVAQSRAYKRMMPDASLDIVEGGGHFAYFIGDADCQRRALSTMMGQAGAKL